MASSARAAAYQPPPAAAAASRDPGPERVIRAIVFDLDNTLTDFMRMKEAAIQAAIDGMIDAGFQKSREELRRRVQAIYDVRGLEFQRVFDELLELEFGEVDPKILASGVVAALPGLAATVHARAPAPVRRGGHVRRHR